MLPLVNLEYGTLEGVAQHRDIGSQGREFPIVDANARSSGCYRVVLSRTVMAEPLWRTGVCRTDPIGVLDTHLECPREGRKGDRHRDASDGDSSAAAITGKVRCIGG
ncbi:hypothetical protein BSE24067_03716 [Burkholderia seminalis]|nr:hypothetical protein BSE24067_03716 [Burkholderia seminalis]